MENIYIRNGRLLDPAQKIDAKHDIFLADGLVKNILPAGGNPPEGAQVIEAEGFWLTPGLIDMHVHLREPGHEYKETVESGAQAAAAGGFTAVLAMPNTSPALDNAEQVAQVIKKGQVAGGAKVYVAAAMTRGRKGEELCEYADLKEAGAVAVTDDGSWVTSPKVMRRILDYAAVMDLLPLSHTEDHELSKGGAMNESRVSTRLGLAGIPAQAEINAVARDINMVELTGRPLHLCHLSSKGSIDLVRTAKAKGLPVSCETAPHYLHLIDEAVVGYQTNAKMNPPLRQAEDQKALREALADGTIEVIATDHAPHSVLEKELEFQDAAFGITGLETSLPLIMELVDLGLISPGRLVELMSLNPARLLKIKGGTLAIGEVADLTIIDPNCQFSLQPQDSKSKSKNSPFWGRPLKGRAVKTIVDGQIVFSL